MAEYRIVRMIPPLRNLYFIVQKRRLWWWVTEREMTGPVVEMPMPTIVRFQSVAEAEHYIESKRPIRNGIQVVEQTRII